MPPGPTERSRSYSRPDHNNGRLDQGSREHRQTRTPRTGSVFAATREESLRRNGEPPPPGTARSPQQQRDLQAGQLFDSLLQPPRQQQQQPQQQQARMPQGSAGPQPIGRPMPPPSMVQTGMQQQQNMPMYNGLMQPVDVRTGLPMQITGMPPMGGAPLGMAPRGVVPQQHGMQPAGHIIPPGGTMVGASTQQLGMMPPMMGMTGMQPTHFAPPVTGMGMTPMGMMMQPGMMSPAHMVQPMAGMGMPPTGTSSPMRGQPPMSMTQLAGMVVQPGMTQPGIMQPGHVASMPVQMGPALDQAMPPPPPRPMTQPPMAGMSPGQGSQVGFRTPEQPDRMPSQVRVPTPRQATGQQHGSEGPDRSAQEERQHRGPSSQTYRERAQTGIHSLPRDNHLLQHCHTAFYDEGTGDLVAYESTGELVTVCEFDDLAAYGYQWVAQDGPMIHCGHCGALIKVRTSPPLVEGGQTFWYLIHHPGNCHRRCTACKKEGFSQERARDTRHLELGHHLPDCRFMNYIYDTKVHEPDCVKNLHRRLCIIGYNRGRDQKQGDRGECNDINFHRLCLANHCSVMRQARADPLSVPRDHNPFHHPIRPLLLRDEVPTRVQVELEDPRQVRNPADRPPVITVGQVAYRKLSRVPTGPGAQQNTGWGAQTPGTPRTQNAGGWGAPTPDRQQAGQNTGAWHVDGRNTMGTTNDARQNAPMTDQDESTRQPLSEHVIRPKFLSYEVAIDVRMCNGITAAQDPEIQADGDTGQNMDDGLGSRRHEGETIMDRRKRMMTDAWKKTDETYRSQVRDELSAGRCGDDRYEELFDDLCPPAIRIPPGVSVVRTSEMITLLWEVTGLRDDARRETPRERQSRMGTWSESQPQSGEKDRAYETVSPTKLKSMAAEKTITDSVEKQRKEVLRREMPDDLREDRGEKPPLRRSLPFDNAPQPMETEQEGAPPQDPIAALTAQVEQCKNMVIRMTQKQTSLENIGVREGPHQLAAAQWQHINDSHPGLAGGQRLVGLATFEAQVHAALVAAGVAVYRYDIRMSHKAIGMLDQRMDRDNNKPPSTVAYLATPGAGKKVVQAWRDLTQWVKTNGWEDVFWRTLLGLVIYTCTTNDMQEMNDKYYLRASMIMMDAWEGVSDFTRVKNMKKRYYEEHPSVLEIPLPVACRWDHIFRKLLAYEFQDETINIPDRLQSEDYLRITYDILRTAHSRVQIIDSEANEVKRLRDEITMSMPLVNYDRPAESSSISRVPAYHRYIDGVLREFETVNKAPYIGAMPLYIDLMLENMAKQPWIATLRKWIFEPNGNFARGVVPKDKFWDLVAQLQQGYERERDSAMRTSIGSIDGPGDRRQESMTDMDGDEDMRETTDVNAMGYGPHRRTLGTQQRRNGPQSYDRRQREPPDRRSQTPGGRREDDRQGSRQTGDTTTKLMARDFITNNNGWTSPYPREPPEPNPSTWMCKQCKKNPCAGHCPDCTLFCTGPCREAKDGRKPQCVFKTKERTWQQRKHKGRPILCRKCKGTAGPDAGNHCPADCESHIRMFTRKICSPPFRTCHRVTFPPTGPFARTSAGAGINEVEVVTAVMDDANMPDELDDEWPEDYPEGSTAEPVAHIAPIEHAKTTLPDDKGTQGDKTLPAWHGQDSWCAPVIVLEEDEAPVRISEIDVVHLPKDSCMSDSGAGTGVDPSLQNFERIQPSNATLLAANGTKMDNRGKGIRRRLVETDDKKIVAVYDEAYHCPDAPAPIASEGQHVKQGGSVLRAGHRVRKITIEDIDGQEKILTPDGQAKTWWLYPDMTAVPLVKGKNGVIDYTVPVQPTQYDEATRLLGRDEIAHKYQQSKTVSSMDVMADVQDRWLNIDFDVSVEKYQRDMLEIQRQMERCCHMQHKLRGMSDEDTTELAHAIHEQVVEWSKRVQNYTKTEPAMPKTQKHGLDPHLVPLACAKCEQAPADHGAYTCPHKCAECQRHEHAPTCSKHNTKNEYIHSVTKTAIRNFKHMPDEQPRTQRQAPTMDAVDERVTDEAYKVLNIVQQQHEQDATDQGDTRTADKTTVDIGKKKEMIQACGWKKVMDHSHSIADVLDMPSRLWLNMLTTEERTTLATHAVILDAADEKARALPKHESMDVYTVEQRQTIDGVIQARTHYKQAVAQARGIVQDAMASLYDDSVTGRTDA